MDIYTFRNVFRIKNLFYPKYFLFVFLHRIEGLSHELIFVERNKLRST